MLKKTSFVAAAAAGLMLIGAPAFAQGGQADQAGDQGGHQGTSMPIAPGDMNFEYNGQENGNGLLNLNTGDILSDSNLGLCHLADLGKALNVKPGVGVLGSGQTPDGSTTNESCVAEMSMDAGE